MNRRRLLLLAGTAAGILAWRYRILQVGTFGLSAGLRRLLSPERQPKFRDLAGEWSRLRPLPAEGHASSKWMITYHPWYHGFSPVIANKCLSEAAALGVGYLRADIRWMDLFPDGRSLNQDAWIWYETYLKAAHDWYGLKIFIVLSNASREVLHMDPDARLKAWERYVTEVVGRLGSLCNAYQILNEPNSPVYRIFPPREVPTAIRSATEVIRSQNKNAQTTINILLDLWGWRSDLEEILRATGSSVDVVGLDYYPGTWALSRSSDWNPVIQLLAESRSRRSILYGRKFAILETGYSTNFPVWRGDSEQVRYFQRLEKAVVQLEDEAGPETLVWLGVHELCDEDSEAFLDPEAHFGLLSSRSLQRKPGFTELQRVIRSNGCVCVVS